MLINLTGKIKNDYIEFDLVNLPLDQNSSVAVAQLCIEYKESVRNVCGSVYTTLIERSGLNPLQELITFSHTSQVKNLLYTPPHFLWYKIQKLRENEKKDNKSIANDNVSKCFRVPKKDIKTN